MSSNYSVLARLEHRIYLENKRKKLKNNDPSIIAYNCNGGIIYHDLGLQFLSPTINMGFDDPKNYIKMASNLKYYMNEAELVETTDEELTYPVANLGDIKILFAHYHSFDEAKAAWKKRKSRINWDNLFFIMSDQHSEKKNPIKCTYEDIAAFDELPYPNKVFFSCKDYPEFKSVYWLKEFENSETVGVLSDYKPGFLKRRYLDDFDYVKFLNTGSWK